MSLYYPLPTLQEDVFYRLVSIFAHALACFVNTVEVGSEANLSSPHLYDDRADCMQ